MCTSSACLTGRFSIVHAVPPPPRRPVQPIAPLPRTTTAKSQKHTPFPQGWGTQGLGRSFRGSRIAGGQNMPPSRTRRQSRPSSAWRAPRDFSPRWSLPTPCTTPYRFVPCLHASFSSRVSPLCVVCDGLLGRDGVLVLFWVLRSTTHGWDVMCARLFFFFFPLHLFISWFAPSAGMRRCYIVPRRREVHMRGRATVGVLLQ